MQKALLETIFNYIDLSFQLFSGPTDETFATVLRHMNDLRKYCDRKSSLNVQHSEKIIDIFRFWIRKDKVLSKVLDNKFSGFDESVMDSAQHITIAPQPTSMEVQQQSKLGMAV